jgi:hypothetical protein
MATRQIENSQLGRVPRALVAADVNSESNVDVIL